MSVSANFTHIQVLYLFLFRAADSGRVWSGFEKIPVQVKILAVLPLVLLLQIYCQDAHTTQPHREHKKGKTISTLSSQIRARISPWTLCGTLTPPAHLVALIPI